MLPMTFSQSSPQSSPVSPFLPLIALYISAVVASPLESGISSPVVTSLTGWPRPANIPASGSQKVIVPIPAALSLTQAPSLRQPFTDSGVSRICFSPFPRLTITVQHSDER